MQPGNVVTLEFIRGTKVTSVQAVVLSATMAETHKSEAGDPALSLAYLDPDQLSLVGTSDWTGAFQRVTGVKHATHKDITEGRETVCWFAPEFDAQVEKLGSYISEHFAHELYDLANKNSTATDIAIALLDRQDPATIWYGPHPCPECGAMVIKKSEVQGGAAFEADEPIYPNTALKSHIHIPKDLRGIPQLIKTPSVERPMTVEESCKAVAMLKNQGYVVASPDEQIKIEKYYAPADEVEFAADILRRHGYRVQASGQGEDKERVDPFDKHPDGTPAAPPNEVVDAQREANQQHNDAHDEAVAKQDGHSPNHPLEVIHREQ